VGVQVPPPTPVVSCRDALIRTSGDVGRSAACNLRAIVVRLAFDLRAATAAVISDNSSTAPIRFTIVKVDAEGVGGRVEQDVQMLEQAVHNNYVTGFQIALENLRFRPSHHKKLSISSVGGECASDGYSTALP
jgi:hypothetical protein